MSCIDVWAQQPNERFMAQPWLDTLLRWTDQRGAVAATVDTTLRAMDDGGVTTALLSAWHGPTGPLISNDEVASVVNAHPDRFCGIGAVDLNDPVAAVAEVRRCVKVLGFVAIRVVPWLWNRPPNDRRYYPVYVACVEMGVPVCTQVGHTGPLCPSEPGRPIPYLDDVLLEFPDLTVVAGHVGYPWTHEVLSLLYKYPCFHIDTSAYALHRLPSEIINYMRETPEHRVLFGTNWPMISPKRALAGLDDLDLNDRSRERFLEGNARRVFRVDGGSA